MFASHQHLSAVSFEVTSGLPRLRVLVECSQTASSDCNSALPCFRCQARTPPAPPRLQVIAAGLLPLNGFKKALEVAHPKALVPRPLDDF